jgi:hypothetical protein
MGIQYPKPKSSMDDISEFIPYLCRYSDEPLTVDPDVSLYIRPSELPVRFIPGRHMGLFARKHIVKGTIICYNPDQESKMNDAMIDLGEILSSDTSDRIYEAWMDAKNSYYDIEKAKQDVNVRMITDRNGNIFYETIQDIPINKELLRIYGFTTWVLEIVEILTNKTIVGFAQFVDHLSMTSVGDPCESSVKLLRKALDNYHIDDIFVNYDIHPSDVAPTNSAVNQNPGTFPFGEALKNTNRRSINSIFTINRSEYDTLMSTYETIYVGSVIKALYIIAQRQYA